MKCANRGVGQHLYAINIWSGTWSQSAMSSGHSFLMKLLELVKILCFTIGLGHVGTCEVLPYTECVTELCKCIIYESFAIVRQQDVWASVL